MASSLPPEQTFHTAGSSEGAKEEGNGGVDRSADWLHRWQLPTFAPLRWIGGHGHTLLPPRHLESSALRSGGQLQPGVSAMAYGSGRLARDRPRETFRSAEAESAELVRHLFSETAVHRLPLPDGDAIYLHEDPPLPRGLETQDAAWRERGSAAGSVLLLHGLCGCHAASYMLRFAARLRSIGIRTFRADMRGCGRAAREAVSITHAGRSDDVVAAIDWIARRRPAAVGGSAAVGRDESPIGVIGVSLGGNQVLRAIGRIGARVDPLPRWWSRLGPVLAIAPPIDLAACSTRLEHWSLRPYNRYFIQRLLRRIPSSLADDPVIRHVLARRWPKTLRQFDRSVTAPLAGFRDEEDYYHQSSAVRWLGSIDRPTLIVAAKDDPLVPATSFEAVAGRWSDCCRVSLQPTGGHIGFLQAGRRAWTDDLAEQMFATAWSGSPFVQRIR